MGGEFLGDLVQPLVELRDRPRVQRREGADDPRLALGDHQRRSETMNSGAPMTGSRSLSLSTFGSAIEVPGVAAARERRSDPPDGSHINRAAAPARRPARRLHFGSRQPRANISSALHHDRAVFASHGSSSPRLLDQRVRRVDDEKPGARERLLPVRADRPRPTSSSAARCSARRARRQS